MCICICICISCLSTSYLSSHLYSLAHLFCLNEYSIRRLLLNCGVRETSTQQEPAAVVINSERRETGIRKEEHMRA